MTVTAAHDRAPTSPQLLVVILGLLSAFAPLATDLYLPGFPLLAQSFGVGDDRVQITLSVFFLGLALGQALYGPVIDRYGRRGPLLAGIAIYIAGTLVCLVTTDINLFTAARFVEAVGGCAGMVVGRAIVNDLYDETEGARALSLLMIVMTMMPIVAPGIGGIILAVASWRAIFVVILIIGTGCGLLTFLLLPETLPADKRSRTPLSAGLADYGRLLRNHSFLLPTLAGGFALGCMFAFISGSPFVLIQLHHVGERSFGYLFGLVALGLVIAAQVNRSALSRWSTATLLSAALTANVVASLILIAAAGSHSLWVMFIPLWLTIASVGFIGANATAIAMAAAGSASGSGSALIGVLQFACAFAASAVVSQTQNATAYPMTLTILACATLARLTWALACIVDRRRRTISAGG